MGFITYNRLYAFRDCLVTIIPNGIFSVKSEEDSKIKAMVHGGSGFTIICNY
jgi:hypothetical protein